MRARAPGSTSNLGPGFDVLGLALNVYVEVEITPSASFSIETEGEGADLARDESHLGARVAAEVLGHSRFAMRVRSEIPVGRGLGSSAALVVAAAAAAGASDPFGIATRSDGHAENAAASVKGGLVAASIIDGTPQALRLPLDPSLCFVVLVPDRDLSTRDARAALPSEVAFGDAVFNLGRLALLIAGLSNADELLSAAGEDRLHQDARASLFPESVELLAALRQHGATIACWSGAGSSLLGICASSEIAGKVRDGGEAALHSVGLPGIAKVLEPDLFGVRLSD